MLTDSKTGNQPRCQDNSKPLISKVLLRTCTTRLSAASGEVALQIRVVLSDLCDVLQHSHVSHLLLDGSVVVNLVPKLGSVGCMVHLTKSGKAQAAIRPQFIILSQEFDSSHKIWGNKLLQVVFFGALKCCCYLAGFFCMRRGSLAELPVTTKRSMISIVVRCKTGGNVSKYHETWKQTTKLKRTMLSLIKSSHVKISVELGRKRSLKAVYGCMALNSEKMNFSLSTCEQVISLSAWEPAPCASSAWDSPSVKTLRGQEFPPHELFTVFSPADATAQTKQPRFSPPGEKSLQSQQ